MFTIQLPPIVSTYLIHYCSLKVLSVDMYQCEKKVVVVVVDSSDQCGATISEIVPSRPKNEIAN